MPSDRWLRIEKIFKAAADLEGEDRADFVDRACLGDRALRDEVLELLHHDRPLEDGPLTAAVHGAVARDAGPGPAAETDAAEGGRVGPYRIEREIGRGGMGSVYLAVRADAQFRKEVAIKVMRHSVGRPDLLQRFRIERQILATLEHPNIARMLDGGTTASGAPYVVMEYVEGERLDDHCNGNRLGTTDRVRLLAEVCAAVQYAHRNLVVHRDLKPGNILVNREGSVKLLDFGIAKLLNPDLASAPPPETATENRVLTPEYASPEQLKGDPITTATDVYGLGVVLYELLAGRRPYRLRRPTAAEVERAILDEEPDRPSAAIGRASAPQSGPDGEADSERIARERGTTPARLRRQLRGDLDNIVLKALRKEPGARYASAEDLEEDLRRHLQGLPVGAQAATLGYRTRKFVGRNAAFVAASLAATALLGSLLAVHTVRLQRERDRARAAEQRALDEARISAATSEFLTQIFHAADPRQGGRRELNAEGLLDAGLERLTTDRSLDLKTRADLRLTLGLALFNLGREEKAVENLRLSIEDCVAAYGRESLETAEALHRLGDVLRNRERFEEALPLLKEALAIRERFLEGDSHEMADSYNNLAILVINLGEYAESERLQIAAIDMHSRLAGPDSQAVAVPLLNLALLKYRQGRLDEAEVLARRALAILPQGTDRPSELLSRHLLAGIRLSRGEAEDALAEYRAVHDEQSALLGPGHRRTLVTARNIGISLAAIGDLAAARRQLEQTLRQTGASLGTASRAHAEVQAELALLDQSEGRAALAADALRAIVPKLVAGTAPRHFSVPARKRQLAEALIAAGDPAGAEPILREALDLLPAAQEYPYIERARILIRLARIDREMSRTETAVGALAEAQEIIDFTTGAGSLESGLLLVQRAALAIARGDLPEAEEDLRLAGGILPRFLGAGHPDRGEWQSWRSSLPGGAGDGL